MTLPLPSRLALDPPLDPSGDEARSELRRELVRPEYHETNPVERLLRWLDRVIQDSVGAAGDAPPLVVLAGSLVLIALGLGVGLLVARTRRTARSRADRAPALGDERVSADALRSRAERALAEGRHDDALVDAFRAVAVRQVERHRIDDLPGATAHEVAVALAEVFPGQGADVHRCAALFDLVLYGGRAATRAQAVEVLGLDDRLGVRA